jgi:hypothetical protein
MASSLPHPPRQLSERTVAALLQGALWVLLAGFYWAWFKRPNYYIEGNIWPVVVLYVGFAIGLFNSLVYWIIPRWLLRERYWPALAGAGVLVVAYRYWFYLGAQFALAYLPLNPDLRRDLPNLGGPTPWVVLTSPVQFVHTFRSMLGSMLLPVLVGFLAYALIVDRRRLALERSHFRLELSYLKAQLNPQFLFHTLGQLQGLTRAGDARAGDVVLHLADLLRYTLYETDAERVPLARELEFTADYLALERLRYPVATITHSIVGAPSEGLRITPLLLHPLLEQLFAALDPADTFTLDSTLHLAPAGLTWELTRNTATPLPPYTSADAVLATKRRLELQYPDGHELRIAEEPTSLRVVLRLAL